MANSQTRSSSSRSIRSRSSDTASTSPVNSAFVRTNLRYVDGFYYNQLVAKLNQIEKNRLDAIKQKYTAEKHKSAADQNAEDELHEKFRILNNRCMALEEEINTLKNENKKAENIMKKMAFDAHKYVCDVYKSTYSVTTRQGKS